MRRSGLLRWAVFAAVTLFGSASTALFGHEEQHHQDPGKPEQTSARDVQEMRWGQDYFPNVTLVTHEGKTVRFFDDLIKNKVVSINFMYASCPDSCPLETARLVTVQRILGDRVGRDIFMYSITIDPKHDTPEVLKAYAEKFKVAPGWLFLTGKEEDITLLRRKLGLYQEAVEEDTADHSLSLVTGNQATGKWSKRSPFDNPYILAEQLGSWLHNWKYGSVAADQSYAEAPLRLRNVSLGENLFRGRCTACHTIGGGDVRDVARGNLGPDLLGVTKKRERGWLTRWLANPEKMLTEKDPLALELYTQYNKLKMPNAELNQREIAAVIEYIEAESHRIEHPHQEHTHPTISSSAD